MRGVERRKRTRGSKHSSELSLGRASPIEDPLSNYVILNHIFSYLDNPDIESCCQVNKHWNSIADPLFVRYYNVTLEETDSLSAYTSYKRKRRTDFAIVSISKPLTYDSGRLERLHQSLKDATKFLEAAARTRKISIKCNTFCSWDENEEAVTDFLSKFGSFVSNLSVSDDMTTRRLCEMLVRFFPNVQQLDISNANFEEPDDMYFDEKLFENRLKKLKRIDEGEYASTSNFQSWVNIFRMAPNLEEIHGFPILHAEALGGSGKGHCVKSLLYPVYPSQADGEQIDEEFRTAFEQLANLDLKLASFEFYYDHVWPEFFCTAEVEPFVRRIMETSCGSLESLSLYRTETFDFEAFSPMHALKTVNFMPTSADQDCFNFISDGTVLSNVFPKASNVKILDPLCQHPVSRISRWFPKTQFGPWAIRKLTIDGANVDNLQVMSEAFPSLTELDLVMENGDLQRLIPAISGYWPEIEFLTIRIPSWSNYRAGEDDWSFDSVFTGIPKRDLVLFRRTDPVDWDTVFSSKKLENWKERSPLRKFSNLKVLKFDLTDGFFWDKKFMERLSAATLVSKEFGFQFLPELKFVVLTLGNEEAKKWHLGMKSSLEPVVNFKLETPPPIQ